MAKKLLNEAAVRRFQKLANLAPINETYHANRDEEQKNEGAHEETEENLMKEEEGALDLTAKDEAPMDDNPMDDNPMGDDADEETLEITDEKLQDFVSAVESIADFAEMFKGQAADMEPGGEDMDAPLESGPDAMTKDADPMDDDEDMDSIMEALKGINYSPSQKEIVNEVAQRVAKRLKSAKLHEAKMRKALGRK